MDTYRCHNTTLQNWLFTRHARRGSNSQQMTFHKVRHKCLMCPHNDITIQMTSTGLSKLSSEYILLMSVTKGVVSGNRQFSDSINVVLYNTIGLSEHMCMQYGYRTLGTIVHLFTGAVGPGIYLNGR